ncbi:MAG: PaaI family thioesterase [Halioglobus sp.]
MTDIQTPEGFKQLKGISPAEDDIGPFFYRKEGEGNLRMGFRVKPKNCNGIGSAHGGVMMAFADYVATMVALSGVKENCATISCTTDFMGAALEGDWVEGTAEVMRRTKSLTFLRGDLHVAGDCKMTFQVVMRRLSKPGSS